MAIADMKQGVTLAPSAGLNKTLASLDQSIQVLNATLLGQKTSSITSNANAPSSTLSNKTPAAIATAGNTVGKTAALGLATMMGGPALAKSMAPMFSKLFTKGFGGLYRMAKGPSRSQVLKTNPEAVLIADAVDSLRKDQKKNKTKNGFLGKMLAGLAAALGAIIGKIASLLRKLNPLRLLSSALSRIIPGRKKKDVHPKTNQPHVDKNGRYRDEKGRFTKKPTIEKTAPSKMERFKNFAAGAGRNTLTALKFLGGGALLLAAGAMGNKMYEKDRASAKKRWGDDRKNVDIESLTGARSGNRDIMDIATSLGTTAAKIVGRATRSTIDAVGEFIEKPSIEGVAKIGMGLVKDVVRNLTNPLELIGNITYGAIGAIFGSESAVQAKRFIEGSSMKDMKSELDSWRNLLNDPAALQKSGYSVEEVKKKIANYQQESIDLLRKGGFTGILGNIFVSSSTEMARGTVAIAEALRTMTDEEIKKQFNLTRKELEKTQAENKSDYVYKNLREAKLDFENTILEYMRDQGITNFDEAEKAYAKDNSLKYKIMKQRISFETNNLSEREGQLKIDTAVAQADIRNNERAQRISELDQKKSDLEAELDKTKDIRKRKEISDKIAEITAEKKFLSKFGNEQTGPFGIALGSTNIWDKYAIAMKNLGEADAANFNERYKLATGAANLTKAEIVRLEKRLKEENLSAAERNAINFTLDQLRKDNFNQEKAIADMEKEALIKKSNALAAQMVMKGGGLTGLASFAGDMSEKAMSIKRQQAAANNAVASARTPEELKHAQDLQNQANADMIKYVRESKNYYKDSKESQSITAQSTKDLKDKGVSVDNKAIGQMMAEKINTSVQHWGDVKVSLDPNLNKKLEELKKSLVGASMLAVVKTYAMSLSGTTAEKARLVKQAFPTTFSSFSENEVEQIVKAQDAFISPNGQLYLPPPGKNVLRTASGKMVEFDPNDDIVASNSRGQVAAPPPGYNGMTMTYSGSEDKSITLLGDIKKLLATMVEKIDKVQSSVTNVYSGDLSQDNVVKSLSISAV